MLENMHIRVYNKVYIKYYKGDCRMTRKQAREEAFILIFEKLFNDCSIDEILELAAEVRDLVPDEYIKNVFKGVFDNLDTIDGIINENAIGWKINRISKTALSVLRLSIYEMKFYDEIPVSVSINEAVELCKKYATKEDASFVNGILSTVAKSLN